MTTANAQRFFAEYEKQLSVAVKDFPMEYAFGMMNESHVHQVAQHMKAAFVAKSYNKEGRAVKAVCRMLGVKHTYSAIDEYIST